MKNIHLITILFIICILLSTSCKKSIEDESSIEKQKFEDNVKRIINIINNDNTGDSMNETIKNKYIIMDKLLYEYQYTKDSNVPNLNIIQSLNDYTINNGSILKKDDNSLYLTIENDDYCAVKPFNSDNIRIYSIDEKSKCHIVYHIGKEVVANIVGYNTDNIHDLYNSNDVSNHYISLFANSNILDDYNCTYKWYRNGEEIEDSNVSTYVITKEYENADYYVEIVTPKGRKAISKPINVKINIK